MRNATLTAATLIALKLAWRKFFALLAIGRRAEEMATSFQLGMLFDHYCAKLHVGAGVDREQAAMLRQAIFGALSESERQAFVAAFREGGGCWAVVPGGAELAERSHPAGGRALGRERRQEHRSGRGGGGRRRRDGGPLARSRRARPSSRASAASSRATWPGLCRRSSAAGGRLEAGKKVEPEHPRAADPNRGHGS